MKTNNLNNILKTILFSLSVFLIEINNSFAQDNIIVSGSKNFKTTVNSFTDNVLTSATTLLMTGAFVLFFYGVVRFIYDRSSGDETRLEKDKEAMLWGLIALFVMVSTWGIIKMFQGFLGIQNDNNIKVQSVQFLSPSSNMTTSTDNPASAVAKVDTTKNFGNNDTQTSDSSSQKTINQPLVLPGTTPSKDVAALIDKYLASYACFPKGINSIGTTYDKGLDSQYVQNFQKANKITVDGKIGKDTWAAFISGTANSCQ